MNTNLTEARPATDKELEDIRQEDIKKQRKKEIDAARYAKDSVIEQITLEISELKNSLLKIKGKKKIEEQNILIKKKEAELTIIENDYKTKKDEINQYYKLL